MNNLYQTVLAVLDLEGLPDNQLTLKAAKMVEIVASERAKKDRVRRWNERLASKR